MIYLRVVEYVLSLSPPGSLTASPYTRLTDSTTVAIVFVIILSAAHSSITFADTSFSNPETTRLSSFPKISAIQYILWTKIDLENDF